MGRSGCRLPGHSGSEALMFPLHTSAQPWRRGAARAAVLPLPCASELMFPLPQHTQSSGKPALSLQLLQCQRS